MAELIAVVGESGSGKTTSIRNLNPSETFIVSPTGKRPGVRGAQVKYPTFEISEDKKSCTGNFYVTTNVDKLANIMNIINKKLTHIKYVVIDDFQYFMAFEAMDRAKEKSWN